MPRKKQVTPVVESVEVETPETPPTCAQCSRVLDWRDAFYAPPPKKPEDAEDQWTPPPPICKRCHQRVERRRVVVAFHPATRLIDRKGEKPREVPVTRNRMARRGHLPLSMMPSLFDSTPTPKTRKPTRAERRAAARKKAAEAQAA